MKSFIIGFLLIVSLGSCQKESVPPVNKHSIIFEKESPDIYWYSDHHPDSLSYGNVNLPVVSGQKLGQGIQYEFNIENDTVYAKAAHQIDVLIFRNGVFDKRPDTVPVINGEFKHLLTTNGFFIAQLPWKD